MSRKRVTSMLVKDDAAKFLEALPDAQRRPQYVRNKLPESPETFSEAEKKAAVAIFAPKKGPIPTDHE